MSIHRNMTYPERSNLKGKADGKKTKLKLTTFHNCNVFHNGAKPFFSASESADSLRLRKWVKELP